jgi:hypothetical protein
LSNNDNKSFELRHERFCVIFLPENHHFLVSLLKVALQTTSAMFLSSKRDDENVHDFKEEFMHEPGLMQGYNLVAPPQGLHVSQFVFEIENYFILLAERLREVSFRR